VGEDMISTAEYRTKATKKAKSKYQKRGPEGNQEIPNPDAIRTYSAS